MRLPAPGSRLPVLGVLAAAVLACDGGLEPLTDCAAVAQICGTITFTGTIPDSTEWVRVVAYRTRPTAPQGLFTFNGPSDALPYGNPTAEYRLSLPAGTYEWVLAVWKKIGTLNPDGSNADSLLKEAGSYRDPADTSQLGIVVVPATGVRSVDILVDFDNMRSVSDFFPAPLRRNP
jgi:hypothetical protein